MAYKKFLIQQETASGSAVGSVVNTYTQFGIVCQEFPFKHLPESKDLPKRDWYDEHGEDVYVPADGLKFKAYDVEATFLYVGNELQMSSKLKEFIAFIYGRNSGGSPMLRIYDEYTDTGRKGVYVLSHSNDLFFYNDVSIDAIARFKVKFRVTDPVTNISLNG